MTTAAELRDSIDSFAKKAFRIRDQRDALLAACKEAYEALDNVYDVDQPEPDHFVESPFSGAGEVMRSLKCAIEKAERPE